jgi:hypothetical protein
MNLIKTFILSSNGSKEEHETLDRAPGLLQEFPMGRTSCHVESPWVAYYVYPWSSTILINIYRTQWKNFVLFTHSPSIRSLQSSELQKGHLKGDVHELITTRSIKHGQLRELDVIADSYSYTPHICTHQPQISIKGSESHRNSRP